MWIDQSWKVSVTEVISRRNKKVDYEKKIYLDEMLPWNEIIIAVIGFGVISYSKDKNTQTFYLRNCLPNCFVGLNTIQSKLTKRNTTKTKKTQYTGNYSQLKVKSTREGYYLSFPLKYCVNSLQNWPYLITSGFLRWLHTNIETNVLPEISWARSEWYH